MATIVKSVCPKDCPDTCGMLTRVEDGRVVEVSGDPEHPITDGWLCGRFQHYEELVHHPNRLLTPLVRESKDAPFEEANWEEAVALVTNRFTQIIEERGGRAILPYSYLAHMGVLATRYADRLWNRMGTARVGMEICAMAGAEAVIRTFGQIRGTEPEHLDKTRLYIAWGKNPMATNVHGHVLVKDVPTVVIDPRRSETAAAADLHIAPRPGTDSALAMGVMRIMIENDWVDRAFLDERTFGYEALRDAVWALPLEEVATITDVPLEQIRELATLYHSHRPGLINLGVGLQRNANGGEMIATIAMLGALSGQVGTPGGGVLYANFDWGWGDISQGELRQDVPEMHNMVELGRDLTATDEIRALYVYNSNPAATTPNPGARATGPRARGPLRRRPRHVPDRHRGPCERRAPRVLLRRVARPAPLLLARLRSDQQPRDRAARRVTLQLRCVPRHRARDGIRGRVLRGVGGGRASRRARRHWARLRRATGRARAHR
jgi:anaerobic selenocysteine-containing dehydrogenase